MAQRSNGSCGGSGEGGPDPTKVIVNQQEITLVHNVPISKYDVRMYVEYPAREDGTLVEKELTKQVFDDSPQVTRHHNCTVLFEKIVRENAKFFGKEYEYTYDQPTVLYSVQKLEIDQGGAPAIFHTDPNQGELIAPLDGIGADATRVRMEIKPVAEPFELTYNDLGSAHKEESGNLLEFPNIVVNQGGDSGSLSIEMVNDHLTAFEGALEEARRQELAAARRALDELPEQLASAQSQHQWAEQLLQLSDILRLWAGMQPARLDATTYLRITQLRERLHAEIRRSIGGLRHLRETRDRVLNQIGL